VDAVIKIGGSLAEEPKALRKLCMKLSELAKKYAVIFVPGGGRFADVVRIFDKRYTLSNHVSHKMAILAIDQFGLLLSDIMPDSYVFHRLEDAKAKAEANDAPVFLPSTLMFEQNPLENSWAVTSDSIAAHVAKQVDAKKLILVTNVDGVFTSDPRKNLDAKLIERLTISQLSMFNDRTSVDSNLHKMLLNARFECYVVNGQFPERIEAILRGIETTCTFVVADMGQ
jgi:aspartokinase-like uncharacterized kinase